MLRYFLSIYRGEHLSAPGVSLFTCTNVELVPADAPPSRAAPSRGVALQRPRDFFPLDVDGDALGDLLLSVEVAPARLRVLA